VPSDADPSWRVRNAVLARVGIYPPLNTVASFWTPIFIVIAILGLEIFFFGHVESRAAKVAFGVPGGRS
jgi:hypothetical protein